ESEAETADENKREAGEVGASGEDPPQPSWTLTLTGAMVGTPAYMAPEQFLAGRIDERADQFSFCVTLHEALYGVRPFYGDDLRALANAVTSGKFAPMPSGSSVPGWVAAVIRRGLSLDPEQRFPSMQALLEELRLERRQRGARLISLAALAVAGITGATINHF